MCIRCTLGSCWSQAALVIFPESSTHVSNNEPFSVELITIDNTSMKSNYVIVLCHFCLGFSSLHYRAWYIQEREWLVIENHQNPTIEGKFPERELKLKMRVDGKGLWAQLFLVNSWWELGLSTGIRTWVFSKCFVNALLWHCVAMREVEIVECKTPVNGDQSLLE